MRRWVLWMGIGLLLVAFILGGCGGKDASPTPAAGGQGLLAETVYLVDERSVERTASPPGEGDVAPNFSIVAPDGKKFSLKEFRGHPVIINFWATWCPPCRMEMPALNRAYLAHKDEGLVMIAVDEMEEREQVESFRRAMKVVLPMALDTRGLVGRTYLVRGLPTTFFIRKDGTIAVRWTGMLRESSLDMGLKAILGQ